MKRYAWFLLWATAACGEITNVRVTGVTSTQAVIAYTAPNLSACTVEVYDGSGYRFAGLKIAAATNASPIAITTDAQHTLVTGDKVYVTEVRGNTNANGYWSITVTGSGTFILDTSVGNGAYTSGGSVAVVVHDVNARLFGGSDQDSRTGNLVQERERILVIGKRVAELALDGWRKSRALQADTTHYYRIVCGSDTAAGRFRTASVPLGQLYNDPIPPDRVHPGDVAWPDFDWNTTGTTLYSNSQYTVVDPHTGALARLLTVPRYLYLTTVVPQYAVDRGGGSREWTNPSYVLADDSSSATYTGDGASTSQPWLAIFPDQWAAYEPLYGMAGDYEQGHRVKFTLKGSSTGGAGENSKVQYCFSVDGGLSCQSAVEEQDLRSCGGAGCTLGDDEPLFRFWQDPTDRTKALQPRWNLTGRVGAANYVAATKVVTWVSGGFFNPLWAAGSRFVFTGGTEPGEYVIASVDSAKQITLSTGPATNQAGAAFAAQNFALMVRKKTNSANTVGINYLATLYGNEMGQIHGTSGGDSGFCSLVKVARPSDGKRGYHCTFGPNMPYYWVDPDTGDATFLGRPYVNVAAYGPNMPSGGNFDPEDPDIAWATVGGTPGLGLVAFTYTGNHEDMGWVYPSDLNPNFSATVYGEINAAVAAYMASDLTGPQLGGRTCTGVLSGWNVAPNKAYGLVWCTYGYYLQDYSPMVALVDFKASRAAHAVQVIGAVSPHSYYPLRYMAIHSCNVIAAPLFPYVGGQIGMAGGFDCSAGPLQTEIAAASALRATATESCPANSFGTTGECANPAGCASGCSIVGVKGEPYDPSPCQWWGRITDPVTLTTLTSIVASSGTATISTTSGQVAAGRSVRVSGTGIANLDGDYRVASSGANTFTFSTTAATGTYAVAGSWVAELWGSPATVVESPFRGSSGIYGAFQNAMPGDMFRVPGATGNELVQILEKTDSTHWKVLRNVACPRVASGWALKLESHSADSVLTGQAVHLCISEDTWAWDVTNDPRGKNWPSSYSKLPGRHGGYNTFRNGALFENSNRNTYDFFDGIATIDAKITTGADLAVGFAPKFAGKSGNMGTSTREFHPSWPADAPYGVDVQAWWAGAQSAPATTFSKVTGTLYSALASGANALDRKHFPTLATCGHHPLADVSGAASTITGNYIDRYKYCVVNASGECVAGSNPAVANVYINCPEISQTTCLSAESDTDYNLLTDPCIYDLAPNVSQVSLIHRPTEPYDPNSAWIQNLGHKFSRWRAQSVFASARITPGGELAYTVTRYLEGVRSEAIAYKIPATPTRSSANRPTFAALTRQVGSVPAGTDNVAVEFGYDANLYCTTRQEVCVSVTGGAAPQPVNETAPFYWSGESYSGVPCSTGCTLTIPAVPERVVYYRFKYRTASGATLETSPTEVVVWP